MPNHAVDHSSGKAPFSSPEPADRHRFNPVVETEAVGAGME